MKIPVVLTLLTFASSAAATGLCTGQANAIAPAMRIQETDLTREAAAEAAEHLADRIRKDALDGESELGVLNARKTIEGYLLRRHAVRLVAGQGPSDPAAADARAGFCAWLASDGFWYD